MELTEAFLSLAAVFGLGPVLVIAVKKLKEKIKEGKPLDTAYIEAVEETFEESNDD